MIRSYSQSNTSKKRCNIVLIGVHFHYLLRKRRLQIPAQRKPCSGPGAFGSVRPRLRFWCRQRQGGWRPGGWLLGCPGERNKIGFHHILLNISMMKKLSFTRFEPQLFWRVELLFEPLKFSVYFIYFWKSKIVNINVCAISEQLKGCKPK